MSSRRWIVLALSVVLGLVAGGLVYNYVQGLEDDKNRDTEEVAVYVITETVEKGTLAETALARIEQTEIPTQFRPENAITDLTEIEGQVAVSKLARNQVVVRDMFASQSEVLGSFSQLLPDDQMAITISVDQIRGVAGLLVPGDYVNILDITGVAGNDVFDRTNGPDPGLGATVEESEPIFNADGSLIDPGTLGDGDVLLQPRARVVYQKAQILAVGTQRQLQPGETAATNANGELIVQNVGLLTLAVSAEGAQWLTSMTSEDLYLALVSADYVPVPLPPVAPSPLYPGEQPSKLTPYGPDGQAAP